MTTWAGFIAEHRKFSGGREPTCFFDMQEIRGGGDWRHRIYRKLAVRIPFRTVAAESCRRQSRHVRFQP